MGELSRKNTWGASCVDVLGVVGWVDGAPGRDRQRARQHTVTAVFVPASNAARQLLPLQADCRVCDNCNNQAPQKTRQPLTSFMMPPMVSRKSAT